MYTYTAIYVSLSLYLYIYSPYIYMNTTQLCIMLLVPQLAIVAILLSKFAKKKPPWPFKKLQRPSKAESNGDSDTGCVVLRSIE